MSSSILHKFIEEDLINEEMLAKAKQIQALNKSGLGFNLALLGANEELLTKKLASYYGIEYIIDLLSIEFDSKVLTLITREKAESMCILSFKKSGKNVLIAVADPIHPELTSFLKELKMLKGIDAEIVIAPKSYIKLAIEQVIPKEQKSRVAEIIKDIAGKDVDLEIVKEQQIQEDIEAVDEAPVIKLCNSLISDAVEKMASDIHIEPFEKEIKIRYRINGTLVEQSSPPVKYKRTIDSRFKVMAKLDIIVKRKPQDERIKIKVKDKMIDLKFSTLPVVWDEKIVMRILDNSNLQLDLTKLGFEPDDLVKFQKAINSTYGIILVTGPNGSDKTTTLYSALSTINSPDINIMTVEVPAEYNLPNINQVQINPKADFTFVNALRAFLRQYPDVIMVGEIRDQETAEIAIKASFTRHLVISTLHIN
ncbi:MAG: GspE/PulE family protein, partial [Candidatus Goldbacteria bacterium]|nr:GspE/PulE family protein [Candidatus Goldiibacteriota bacterium]